MTYNNLIDNMFNENLLYYINFKDLGEEKLQRLLISHPEVQFVSLVGVDLGGNDTDEKIPISLFLEDIDDFIKCGLQTDGSSVVLANIATLNDGKVDLVPDTTVKWFVDYNYGNIDKQINKPVGTLRIPCFLMHNDRFVDSRAILNETAKLVEKEVLKAFSENEHLQEEFQITVDEIDKVILTTATELEFWVKTPKSHVKAAELSASQGMQEQYWKRTKGRVRTALERCIKLLELYGLEPEMGHKEVGGVKATLTIDGASTNILEQMEVDWKYDEALQSADNELLARTFIKDIFHYHGLEVSFKAKPIKNVAGSGEHTHLGISLILKSGKTVNLFQATDSKNDYLSSLGWGAMMGILKNYEVLNPFISSTIDSLERLKPGFEAPVCTVASIGNSIESPSRNRTVLLGLIREIGNPYATRFEIRSPNPHSNTYLVMASLFLTALDGIDYALVNKRTPKELEKETRKKYGEEGTYLETNREYISELDVFDEYTSMEREKLFGSHPGTVYENILNFKNYEEKTQTLYRGNIIDEKILESYFIGTRNIWLVEIRNRLISSIAADIKGYTKIHVDGENSLDDQRWNEILEQKKYILVDEINKNSLVTNLREAIEKEDYDLISKYQLELLGSSQKLSEDYKKYKRNILV